MRVVFLVSCLLTWSGLASLAWAQRPGEPVVILRNSVPVQSKEKIVARVHRGETYVVGKVQGDLIQIRGGWINKADALPFEEGLAHFTKAIEANPADGRAYTARGHIWYDRNQYDKAIAELNDAIRLNPRDSYPYNLRGLSWFGKKEYTKAVADYDAALRLAPSYTAVLVSRSQAWLEIGELAKAIADAGAALRQDPKHPVAYNNRGVAFTLKGDLDMALKDLDEALRISPKLALAWQNRAKVWELQGALDKALADCSAAIQLDPKPAERYRARAVVWRKKGDPDKALEDYGHALRRDPSFAEALYERGKVHFSKGQDDLASADFSAALNLNSKHAGAHYSLALCHELQGELDKALAGYDQAVRLDPDDAEAYRGRGDVRRKKGDWARALLDYNEALRLLPEFVPVYVERGKIRAGRRLDATALADFNEALRLAPQHAEALHLRGVAYYRRSEFAKAQSDLLQFLKGRPESLEALNLLAWLWATAPDDKLRDGKKAVEFASKACQLTTRESYDYLDTLGAAYAEIGDFDAAVKHQTRAVELAPAKLRVEIAERLDLFKARKPYRMPAAPKTVPLSGNLQNLFNGVDFQGWNFYVSPRTPADPATIWSVKNGEIHCKGTAFGYLITKEEFSDYSLELEWKWGPIGVLQGMRQSGVFVHVSGPDKFWPKGIEVAFREDKAGDLWLWDDFKLQVDPARQNTYKFLKNHYHRMIKDGVENPLGQWNKCVIICKGDSIRVEINGKLVNEGASSEVSKGRIFLKCANGEIYFRNVTLQALVKGAK